MERDFETSAAQQPGSPGDDSGIAFFTVSFHGNDSLKQCGCVLDSSALWLWDTGMFIVQIKLVLCLRANG